MTLMHNLKFWHYEQKCKLVVDELTKNGFTSKYCSTRDEVIDYVKIEARSAQTIGLGGSLSLMELNLPTIIHDLGKEILTVSKPGLTQEHKLSIMQAQQQCDLFLASANSVTLGGSLVIMESTGNRISAIIFGPKKTILIIGRNKISDTVDEAILRIKKYVSPLNCKRLNYKTPCTVTGICTECNSEDRSCRITTILDRKPKLANIHVIIVNEDLGL